MQPYDPQRFERIPDSEIPFRLNWRRVAIGLGIFAFLAFAYLICWALGLATQRPGF